jgi:hypothetical protein
VAAHFGVASALVLVSLGVGMWGYEHYEKLGWCDAFLNAIILAPVVHRMMHKFHWTGDGDD